VWCKTIIVTFKTVAQISLILLHSVTVQWPNSDADQKAGCSTGAV
jgi:hypothetical protein